MKLEMMAIYDSAAKAFLPPFCVASEALAIRQFRVLGEKQPDHDFVKFADQYVLFRVGEFENEFGVIEPCPAKSLGTLLAIIGKGE